MTGTSTVNLHLHKGEVTRIPRNTPRRIFDVIDELLVYDVSIPGIMQETGIFLERHPH
ncbi:MAG: hypothetical protein PHY29_01525 [Syntrophales bacterium]|nr:hypothetical protein [Syntrophales bacterium]